MPWLGVIMPGVKPDGRSSVSWTFVAAVDDEAGSSGTSRSRNALSEKSRQPAIPASK